MIKCDNCDVHLIVTSSWYYAHDHKFCSNICRRYWVEIYRNTFPPTPPPTPPPISPPVHGIYSILHTLRDYYTPPPPS